MATIDAAPKKDLDFRVLSSDDEIQMPELRDFYEYWVSLKGDKTAPNPSDFDLLEITDVISTSGVLKVIEGGEDFRVKFLGQGYTIMTKRDTTGKLVSEVVDDPFTKRSQDILRLTTTTQMPVINGLRAPTVDLVDADYIQSLILPLVEDGVVKEIAFAVIAPTLELE